MCGALPPLLNMLSRHGTQLNKKHRDNITFTFYLIIRGSYNRHIFGQTTKKLCLTPIPSLKNLITLY